MDQWDRELAKAGIQMAGAAAKGMGNVMVAVMVAVIDGLIEKGVFSIEEIRDMLDRLEATARRAEGEIEGETWRRKRKWRRPWRSSTSSATS